MKKTIRPWHLPWLTLGLSALGLALRIWLYATGIDEKGFLPAGHPAEILLWILTAVTAAGLFWLTRPVKGQGGYKTNFPASIPGAIGCWAAAAGIFITALGNLMSGSDGVAIITGSLGILCVPALIFAGYSRYRGARSSFLFYALVCVFYIAQLVYQYRHWSADPQLQDYCFQLLASVGLMLTIFQRATFDVKLGKRRNYAFMSLLSFYFCILSIPHCEQRLLYIVMAVWLFTNLCSLRPLRHRQSAPNVPQKPQAPQPPVEEVPVQNSDFSDLSGFSDLPDISDFPDLSDLLSDLEGL